MSLSLVITANVVADLLILGLLAFVMSRASLLRPHRAAVRAPATRQAPVAAAPPQNARTRPPAPAARRPRQLAVLERA